MVGFSATTAFLEIWQPTMPPAIEELERDLQEELVDSDQDAEGEEETDLYQMDAQLQNAVHQAYSGEMAEETKKRHAGNEPTDEADAEGEPDTEVNTGGENDETEPVGAVKLPDDGRYSDEEAASTADADADPAFENESSAASSSESDDEDWEGESNHGDGETEIPSRGNCM